MSEQHSDDTLRQIDELCNRFEAAWKAFVADEIERPEIEQYLQPTVADQGKLLEELLHLELTKRRQQGEEPQVAEYQQRFPEQGELVQQVFGRSEKTPVDSTRTESFQAAETSSATLPDQIGPYKVLQEIGEGAMGTVYMAEQIEPVRRRVALKVIKAGLDTKQVVARFEAERQALAMMDHQNIAKVLDVGVTDDGRPYFAMELVQGIPITKYCDKNRLPLKDRLELFGQVCRAIQHAHQKGVIHRDLKPSNVLVTLYDSLPVAKVIDFGLAKALQSQTRLTDKTLFTEFGQVVGTLEYMSPEQAEMNELSVDTRTDVYSLGVMLYELLTGSTPLERERIEKETIPRVLELIREEEAPRPSRRLSDSGEAISGISEQRQIEPRRLSLILKGELDWIAMKALEKDRARRYEGAGALADDVQRYLDHEAIEARPPSVGYRLQKTIRKHKGAFATGTVIVLLLVAGLIGIGTMWMRAETEAARARQAEKEKADEAEKSKAAEAKARVAELKANDKTAEAERARKMTDELRLQSQQDIKKAKRRFYISDMRMVQSECKANQFDHARQLLERYQEDENKGFEWYYMNRLFSRELFTMLGHETSLLHSQPLDMVFSPSGNRIAILFREHKRPNAAIGASVLSQLAYQNKVSAKGSVRVYNAFTGNEIGRTVTENTNRIIAFKPDETQIVLGNDSEGMTVWDLTTRQTTQEIDNALPSDEKLRLSLPFPWKFFRDKTRIAAAINFLGANGGQRGIVKLLDATTGNELLTLKEFTNWVQSVTFSPDGKRIVVVIFGGEVTVWDTATGAELPNLKVGNDRITGLAVWFSRDGTQIAAEVEVRLKTRPSETFENGMAPFNIEVADLDGQDYQGQVRLWDVLTGKRTLTLAGHSGRVNDLAFSPDGMSIATASNDKTVKLWSFATGDEVLTFTGHTDSVEAVYFSPDGTRIATTSSDGTGKVWDIANATAGVKPGEGRDCCDLSFSRDGMRFVTVDAFQVTRGQDSDGDGGVAVWDVLSGKLTSKLEKHAFYNVPRVWLSPDGSRVAAGVIQYVEAPGIIMWDVSSRKVIHSHILKGIPRHEYTKDSTAFSADGTQFAAGLTFKIDTGRPDGSTRPSSLVQIWETGTGDVLRSLFAYNGAVTSVAFSQDGKQIAASGYDEVLQNLTAGPHQPVYSVKVWDVGTGKLVHWSKGQRATINATTLNHDGTRLATASNDRTVKLWDIATNDLVLDQELHTLKGHKSSVTSVAFSPDGTRVASCDNKGSVKIWDTVTGEELTTFDPEKNSRVWGPSKRVVFSPDGAFLAATGEFNRPVRLWDARPIRPETKIERQAVNYLNFWFERLGTKAQLIEKLNNDKTISQEVREKVQELIKRYPEKKAPKEGVLQP